MPVGGDLGFFYLVLVVLSVGPVIGFVVRRKWQVSVARREEIKRLLVLASEEAARAEREGSIRYATSAPAISRPLQHQCAVCFCPTTTRCARCKAVRYCSGKCQIIHWRQGHKEECRPFSTSYLSNDTGGGSSEKVLIQEENEVHGNNFETEGILFTKSVHNFPEEPVCLKSDFSPEISCVNDDSEVECFADGKGTDSSSDESQRSDGHQSANTFPDNLNTNCVTNADENESPSSRDTILADSVDCLASSGKLNEIITDYTKHDTQGGSTSPSGWSVDGSNESSFSEPSPPTSGFWEGTIKSNGPKINPFDDSAKSSFSSTGNANMHDSLSSISFSSSYNRNVISPADVQGSGSKTGFSNEAHASTVGIKVPLDRGSLSKEISDDVQDSGSKTLLSDDAWASTLEIKMPIDRAVLTEERSEHASKSRSLRLLSLEKSDNMDVCTDSNSPVSKSGESRYCSSKAYVNPSSSAGAPSISTHASRVSSIQSSSHGRSDHTVNDTRATSHPSEFKEGGSLSPSASAAHLSSSTRRHSLQGANPGKVDRAEAVDATSEYSSYSLHAKNGLKTSMWKVVDQLKASKSSRHYQLGVGSEIAGRYNNKGLFSYELFVKLYHWKIELRPCGLTNCGNSCYANAVLQCLISTPPLTAYHLQGLHSKACEGKEWCFTCEFESLILKAKEGISPLSPIGILSQIQNIGSHLGNGRQEDAHEFLRYAIDKMQSVCLKEAGANALSLEETTLIGLTFGGYLRSKIKCMKCGGKSERHERMMDLTVEIDGDIGTLEEALRQFTGTEILDGENKYQCSRCKSYEKAKKKLKVLEAPNILTIALKRFQSGKFGKLNKSIRFPEILDLAPYMSGTSDKSPIYKLYGVVVHLDVMNATFSGHYVCYVKNVQNKWFKIDDSLVKAVDLESVLTKRAYMLLYARCSPRAPRLIRNSIIPRDPRKPKNPVIKSRPHSTGPWDASSIDPLDGHTSMDCLYPNYMSFQPIQKILEEDSSSDNSSSIFSEGNSCSTESSNRDSNGTDDYIDQILGDTGQNWNGSWKNLSDFDSSSPSSSSSSSPTPLYSSHSSLADCDQYSSGHPGASGVQIQNPDSERDDRNGFWDRLPSSSRSSNGEGKFSVPFLNSGTTKQCRKLGSSSSSFWETDSSRLGRLNPFGGKKSVAYLRRLTKERTE